MSVLNNKIIIDGLVFNFDVNNIKSYIGEPTTNILPNPSLNALPTIGNAWGTYNTNQYNSAQYFSIGTISSVTSNIVTTSGNHPLRTYDVVQPQTTGGGLTGGQVYLIKKLSNTTFTIHEYNSSQDGSQGYINPSTGNHKVWDSLATDTRVSINSTNFPTMWWGPPHYPNSGLVKEIVSNGFDAIPGVKTDCIRLHYARPEVDGMSYNVDCTVTPGIPYNVSFWTRSADVNAVGKSPYYYNYNYSGGSAQGYAFSFVLGPLGVWQKQSYSFTYAYSNLISYWFSNNNGPYRWDMANIQVEQKDHATAFSLGTRSNTQGLLDLTGNATLSLSSTSFDSTGTPTFNGTSSYIYVTPSVAFTLYNLDVWIYNNNAIPNNDTAIGGPSTYQTIIQFNGAYPTGINLGGWSGGMTNESVHIWTGTASSYGATYIRDYVAVGWHNLVFNWNGSGYDIWVDGTKRTTYSLSGVLGAAPLQTNVTNMQVGYSSPGYYFNGKIPIVKCYNAQLTDTQVLQNFNATKGRFGL